MGKEICCRKWYWLFNEHHFSIWLIIKLKTQESIWDNKLLNVNQCKMCEIEVLTTLHESMSRLYLLTAIAISTGE